MKLNFIELSTAEVYRFRTNVYDFLAKAELLARGEYRNQTCILISEDSQESDGPRAYAIVSALFQHASCSKGKREQYHLGPANSRCATQIIAMCNSYTRLHVHRCTVFWGIELKCKEDF